MSVNKSKPLPSTLPPFSVLLELWGKKNGRKGLPWQVKDPYRVWLSEVMLQQTQVETVKPYFARFIEYYPTVVDLAKAKEEEVLSLWAGLGYYTRARNLHKAAQFVANNLSGKFPTSREQLMELPGVGKSTGAAISSICFGKKVSILDANALRVYSRFLGERADIKKESTKKMLWPKADSLMQLSKNTQLYTQSLMDLGSAICKPKNPNCTVCPLAVSCQAKAENWFLETNTNKPIVVKSTLKGTKKAPAVRKSKSWDWIALFTLEGKTLLIQQPEALGVWKNMLVFPTVDEIGKFQSLTTKPKFMLGGLLHKFSHFDLNLTLYACVLSSEELLAAEVELNQLHLGPKLVDLSLPGLLPIPKPVSWSFEKVADWLASRRTGELNETVS